MFSNQSKETIKEEMWSTVSNTTGGQVKLRLRNGDVTI